jgi:HNH endonuclease
MARRVTDLTIERFMSKLYFGPGGCWLWRKVSTRTGYAQFTYFGKMKLAHRVAWLLFRGGIPPGVDVAHHCDIRHCVNPYHLFLATRRENMRDAVAKGRPVGRYARAA